MLYAHRVPASGGETEFADLRSAWEALPDKTKAEIDGLVAVHDIAHSRAQIGFTELLFGERETLPPVPQRLVRIHPGSGREILTAADPSTRLRGVTCAGLPPVTWPRPSTRSPEMSTNGSSAWLHPAT